MSSGLTPGVGSDPGVVGRVDRRANALSIVVPVTKPRELKAWLNWLSWPSQRFRLETIDRLRFIYAIRWTVLPPFPSLEPGRPADPRRQLLFESNFDGDWDEYLEIFGGVQGWQLEQIVKRTEAFPGLGDLALFKSWAKSYDHLPEHYASAYPNLSAIDIRQHLARTRGPVSRAQVWHEGFGLRRPTWTTIRLPLQTGRSAAAVELARGFDVVKQRADAALDPGDGPGEENPRWTSSLFNRQTDVHFVRVVVLDRPDGSWILLTLVHDGPVEPIIRTMVEQDRLKELPTMDALLDLVATRPGTTADPADRLMQHRLPADLGHLAYAAYPGTSVAELQALDASSDRQLAWPIPEEDT